MKFPSSLSYLAGPLLGYAARFTFKRESSPFSVYFHCDRELTFRVSALNVIVSLDVNAERERYRRDDVYFD